MDIVVYKSPEGFFLAVEDQFGIKHPIAKFVSEDAVLMFDQVMAKDGNPNVHNATPGTQGIAS